MHLPPSQRNSVCLHVFDSQSFSSVPSLHSFCPSQYHSRGMHFAPLSQANWSEGHDPRSIAQQRCHVNTSARSIEHTDESDAEVTQKAERRWKNWKSNKQDFITPLQETRSLTGIVSVSIKCLLNHVNRPICFYLI